MFIGVSFSWLVFWLLRKPSQFSQLAVVDMSQCDYPGLPVPAVPGSFDTLSCGQANPLSSGHLYGGALTGVGYFSFIL